MPKSAGILQHVIEQMLVVPGRCLAAGQPAAEKPFVDQSRIDFPCHRTVCTFPRDVRAVQPGETDIAVDPRYDRFGAEFQRWQRRESTGLASY